MAKTNKGKYKDYIDKPAGINDGNYSGSAIMFVHEERENSKRISLTGKEEKGKAFKSSDINGKDLLEAGMTIKLGENRAEVGKGHDE